MIIRKIGESKLEYIQRASEDLYYKGYHISEIADKLKCNIFDVYNAVMKRNNNTITTKEERDIMIEMYNNGKTMQEIADIFGRHRTCVLRRIKSNAKLKYEEYKLSNKDLAYLKRKYLKGYTLKSICKELNISYASAKRRLIKAGIYEPNLSKKIDPPKTEKLKYKSLYNKGYSISEIADMFNRQYCVVCKSLGKFDRK